jgi:arsenical pump membrane protein
VEYLVFRRFFRTDLNVTPTATEPPQQADVPVFALIVLAATLVGFAVASLAGVNPAWAAAAGAAVLGVRALARRHTTPAAIWRAAGVPFLAFVLGLGIVVAAVTSNGLAGAAGRVVPGGTSLPALLATAGLAAVAANVINNLPAVLVLLPLAAATGPGAVLAVLIGVNIGPNLTYTGSLATLLWRRVLREHDAEPNLGEFTRLGLLTVPMALVLAVAALWAGLHVLGGR